LSEGVLEVSADRVAVTWAFEGTAKAGELVLGGPVACCRCDFKDSFHMESGMVLHGSGRTGGGDVMLYGTFLAGEGLPDWGWRIGLNWSDPEHFTLCMFTVKPDGLEALAVELRGARAAKATE
jgi:hypothetical protein